MHAVKEFSRISKIIYIRSQGNGLHYCFNFEDKDQIFYVRIHPLKQTNITDFTIDFSYELTKSTKGPGFLSFSTSNDANELVLTMKNGLRANKNFYNLYEDWPSTNVNDFERITVVKRANIVSLYVSGQLKLSKSLTTDTEFDTNGFWVLGQEQDQKEGGGFDKTQQFFGKICDFQMWDKGLDEGEIEKLFSNKNQVEAGNIFDSPPTYEFEKKYGNIV